MPLTSEPISQPYSGPLVAIARSALFATLLVPIIVWPGFFFPFTTIRAVYFRVLVEIACAIMLYLVLRRKTRATIGADPVFLSLLSWTAVNLIAAIFGAAPLRSVFGDHERMGGVWFWVHLLGFYVALRCFLQEEYWRRFFRAAVAVALLVVAFGFAQSRFRIVPIGILGLETGATIGNPGILAAYLLLAVGLCALLAVQGTARTRIVYCVVGFVLVGAMVLTGNRSSALGLLVGAGVGAASYAIWSGSFKGIRAVAIVVLLAAALGVSFAASTSWIRPAAAQLPLVRKLAAGVDSVRIIQWRAAAEGIRRRPLLGVGPENYQIVWSEFHHPEMYRFEGDIRWDRAHNAALDALATTGVAGLIALIGVWVALVLAARRAANTQGSPGNSSAREMVASAVIGCFAAYGFYLLFWFFDLSSAMVWIALAAFIATRAAGGTAFLEFGEPRERRWQTSFVLAAGGAVFVAVLYVHGVETLRMARTLDRATDPHRSLDNALRDYQSVFASPAPVTQHAFPLYANYLRGLYGRFREVQSDPASAALFDSSFVLAVREFERQAVADPLNERISIQHARVLLLGAYYYRSPRLYEAAIGKIQRAIKLAPRRVNPYLVLGLAYTNAQRHEEALAAFYRAYTVYPPHGRTRVYLASAHSALGQNHEAARWLKSALAVGTPDRPLATRIARDLAADGDPAAGGELLKTYLVHQYGPVFVWIANGVQMDVVDYGLAKEAAVLLARGGADLASATLQSAAEGLCLRPISLPRLAGGALMMPRNEVPDCLLPLRDGEL